MTVMNRLVIAAIALGALGIGQTAVADLTVGFAPADTAVGLGSVFSVDIIADIPDPVLGWGLDLGFDGSIISLVSSPDVGAAWLAVFAPDGDELAGLAFPSGISGTDIVLATLTFSADATGETDLALSVTPGDLNEGFALDPTGFADVSFELGHVTVVPAPAAASLGMIGLGVLAWVRRRHS